MHGNFVDEYIYIVGRYLLNRAFGSSISIGLKYFVQTNRIERGVERINALPRMKHFYLS